MLKWLWIQYNITSYLYIMTTCPPCIGLLVLNAEVWWRVVKVLWIGIVGRDFWKLCNVADYFYKLEQSDKLVFRVWKFGWCKHLLSQEFLLVTGVYSDKVCVDTLCIKICLTDINRCPAAPPVSDWFRVQVLVLHKIVRVKAISHRKLWIWDRDK